MLVRIVGLGPGDPNLLTLGSIEALRSAACAVTLLAPPELVKALQSHGVRLGDAVAEAALIVRGSEPHVQTFVSGLVLLRQAQHDIGTGHDSQAQPDADSSVMLSLSKHDDATIAVGVLGNPLSDFPGLALLLRALEKEGARTQIVTGVPKFALAASITMPLVPLPPASTHYTWEELIEIMARLRASCPWDREQTHRTLVPYLIEETYEVVEAIETEDRAALCEELGDLLLQIVFHAQLGTETGAFTVADVIDALSNKMVRRHPHVFGDAVIEDVDTQWRNWEKLKSQEATGQKRKSRLDGIPKHMGALQRGQRMQEKAARVGFDWPGVHDVLDKLQEELTELADARRQKQDDPHVREELGDVFFTLVNLSRAMGIDAETAMREANEKFYKRFSFMEQHAAKDGKSLSDMSLDELEELWQLAKIQAA